MNSLHQSGVTGRLEEYRVLRRLGSGGMGDVHLAFDQRLGRPVALKRVRADASADARWQARFWREARAAAQLNHPHIVQIYDLLDAEDGAVIVMEHVEGETVAERIARSILPLPLIVRIARQVAEGLAAAHEAGLVHRDLKSQNVMLTPAGDAKILDFGLARPAVDHANWTQTGAVLGTFHAMSPEQARGQNVDQRSDLFSLGVMLYEMVAGTGPFVRPTPLETLEHLTRHPPQPLAEHRPDVPPALATLAAALLAKAADERPARAALVVQALRELERTMGGAVAGSEPASDGSYQTPALADADIGSLATGSLLVGGPALRPREDSTTETRPAVASDIDTRPPRGPWTRRRALIASAVALFVLAVVALPRWRADPTLRVLVAPTSLDGTPSPEHGLLTSGVTAALLRGLTGLRGVVAIDPSEVAGHAGPVSALGRAVAADEVLQARVEAGTLGTWLTLTRIRDGVVAWTERFPVADQSGDAVLVATAVAARLRGAYPRHPPRPGYPELDVRPEDYAAFVAVFQQIERGSEQMATALDRLEALLETSPRFFDATVVAASVALSQYQNSRQPADLARCQRHLERARSLGPDEPRVLGLTIQAALAAGDAPQAHETLRTLERTARASPVVPLAVARIAEHEGRLADAAQALASAPPTWRNLWRRADLDIRRGRVAEGRHHLEALLDRWPENAFAQNRLGQLELMYGDLTRAEAIYARLSQTASHRSHWTNLGLARYLRGDYAAAVESYRQALALAPGHVTVLLNLAEAEMELGETASARAHCRQVLDLLDTRDNQTLSLNEQLAQAHCLARLDQPEAAVATVFEIIRAHPEDADVQVQAASVFAVAGETASALACLRAAAALGVERRWLDLPAFASLRGDPSYQAVLARMDERLLAE